MTPNTGGQLHWPTSEHGDGGMRHALNRRLREAERLGLRVKALRLTALELDLWLLETSWWEQPISLLGRFLPNGWEWTHRGVPVKVRA